MLWPGIKTTGSFDRDFPDKLRSTTIVGLSKDSIVSPGFGKNVFGARK